MDDSSFIPLLDWVVRGGEEVLLLRVICLLLVESSIEVMSALGREKEDETKFTVFVV